MSIDWPVVRLGDVAELALGKMLDKKRATGLNPRPYLRNINVRWGFIDTSDVAQMDITDEALARYTVLQGDVLVCEGGEPGRAAVVTALEAGLAYQKALHRIRPSERLDPHYLVLALDRLAQTGELRMHFTGTTIKHLPKERLERLTIRLPDLATQKHLVDLAGDRLDGLRVVREQTLRMQRRLELLEESLLRAALLPTRDAAPLGTQPLPQGWVWKTLAELADVQGGITRDAKGDGVPGHVSVPYLRVANVQRGRLDLREVKDVATTPAKAETLALRIGDVLMNEGGDRDKLGRGWIWKGELPRCIHQNHVFRARIREQQLLPELLSWYGNTWGRLWFEEQGAQTTNLASISKTKLMKLPVPVPPVQAQTALRDRLAEQVAGLHGTQQDLTALLKQLDALRRSVLLACTGGIIPDLETSP